MEKFIKKLEFSLHKINLLRDNILFLFIKPYWPRNIIPNYITYVRVVCGIAIFVLLFFLRIENKVLILSLFCLGALTDLLDGSVARGIDKVTEFGAMLDSTADRILIIPIAVYSLFGPHKWLLLFLLLTEVINVIFSVYYNTREIYLESNIWGKTKMFIVSLVFIGILFVFPANLPAIFVSLLWFSIPISFLSILSKILELNSKKHAKA